MKTKILSACILIMFSLNNMSQVVSTFFSDVAKKIDDALVLDYQGNLYGSHFMGSNVYKISPSGVGSVFASGFNTPNGLAFDSQNNLYVCDLSGNRIYKISYTGVFLDTIHVPSPSGIIKSFQSDTMLFTQYTGNKLSKLAPDGTVILIASGAPMLGSVGLAFNNSGQLYVANFTDRKIFSVNSNTLTYVATVPGPSNGALGFIAFANGFLWGTGYNDHRIYKINPNLIDDVVIFAGTTVGNIDGSLAAAKFNRPNGIISSISGDSLFISDFGSGRIRIISFSASTGSFEQMGTLNSIKIYPSLTSDILNIDYYGDIDTIEIFNNQGLLVHSTIEKQISVGNFPYGVYLVNIKNKTGIIKARFVKN